MRTIFWIWYRAFGTLPRGIKRIVPYPKKFNLQYTGSTTFHNTGTVSSLGMDTVPSELTVLVLWKFFLLFALYQYCYWYSTMQKTRKSFSNNFIVRYLCTGSSTVGALGQKLNGTKSKYSTTTSTFLDYVLCTDTGTGTVHIIQKKFDFNVIKFFKECVRYRYYSTSAVIIKIKNEKLFTIYINK